MENQQREALLLSSPSLLSSCMSLVSACLNGLDVCPPPASLLPSSALSLLLSWCTPTNPSKLAPVVAFAWTSYISPSQDPLDLLTFSLCVTSAQNLPPRSNYIPLPQSLRPSRTSYACSGARLCYCSASAVQMSCHPHHLRRQSPRGSVFLIRTDNLR